MDYLKLRPVTYADLEAIAFIDKEVQMVPWRTSAFTIIFGLGAVGKVAVLNDVIAGFYVATKTTKEFHLANLSVREAFQGCKIGEALLQDAIAYATEAGCDTVTLNVEEHNEVAKHLYFKHGFKQEGRVKDYYFLGKDILPKHALNCVKQLKE